MNDGDFDEKMRVFDKNLTKNCNIQFLIVLRGIVHFIIIYILHIAT